MGDEETLEAGHRKLVRERLVSVAVAFFLSGAGVSLLWSDHHPASLVLGVLMLGGPQVLLVLFERSQREVWRADGSTTEDLFRLELARREDVERRARLVYYVAPPALAAFLVCRWLTFRGGPSLSDLLPSAFMVWVSCHAHVRHRRAGWEKAALLHRFTETVPLEDPPEPVEMDATHDHQRAIDSLLEALDAHDRRARRRWWIMATMGAFTVVAVGAVGVVTYARNAAPEMSPTRVGR